MYAVWFVYDTPKCHRMLRRGPCCRLGLFMTAAEPVVDLADFLCIDEDIVTAIGFLPKCVVAPN